MHMHLNDAGQMVEKVWRALPERFPLVTLAECVVMPNYFHGIIEFRTGEPCVRPKITSASEIFAVRALLAAPFSPDTSYRQSC